MGSSPSHYNKPPLYFAFRLWCLAKRKTTQGLLFQPTQEDETMEAKNMTLEALKWGRGEMRCEVDGLLQKITLKAIKANQIKKAKWLLKLRSKIRDLK